MSQPEYSVTIKFNKQEQADSFIECAKQLPSLVDSLQSLLKGNASLPVQEKEDLISADELAKEFPQILNKRRIYELTHSKSIPHYKVGKRKLGFLKSEVKKWLLDNPVKTFNELSTEQATKRALER
jgi:excisionase family DNA binding protein